MPDPRPYVQVLPGDTIRAAAFVAMQQESTEELAGHHHAGGLPPSAISPTAELQFSEVAAQTIRKNGRDLAGALAGPSAWGSHLKGSLHLPNLRVDGNLELVGSLVAPSTTPRLFSTTLLATSGVVADYNGAVIPGLSGTNLMIFRLPLSLPSPSRIFFFTQVRLQAAGTCSLRLLLLPQGASTPEIAALAWENLSGTDRTRLQAAGNPASRRPLLQELATRNNAAALWEWTPTATNPTFDGGVRIQESLLLPAGSAELQLLLVGTATLHGRLAQALAWSLPS